MASWMERVNGMAEAMRETEPNRRSLSPVRGGRDRSLSPVRMRDGSGGGGGVVRGARRRWTNRRMGSEEGKREEASWQGVAAGEDNDNEDDDEEDHEPDDGGRSAAAASPRPAQQPLHEGPPQHHAAAAEENGLPAAERIPCGMFHWNPPRRDDQPEDDDDDAKQQWCFMTHFGVTDKEKKEIKRYAQLETFANLYGSEYSDELICEWIHEFYDTEIYPHLPPDKRQPWSHSSIRQWIRTRASAANTHNHHLRIINRRIDDITDNELYAYNPSTRRRELRDPHADTRLQKWLRLSRQFESRR